MARTPISRTAVADTGLNLTDATYATLATGAGNGVEVPYREADLLVLKNATGGAAVFTLKVKQPPQFSGQSITVPDKTVTVATGKTWVYPTATIFRQTDGDIYIDCDVAGAVLALALE